MKKIEEILWRLSLSTQSLEDMDPKTLLECYATAHILRHKVHSANISETVRQLTDKLFENIQQELNRRNFDAFSVFVLMDQDGQFVAGREQLKQFWSTLEFEEMLEIADEIISQCKNEAQRTALIDLEREIVLMNN